jgi:hypothetical protein
VKSVEIRDVAIPVALQDAMSRQAQAEREKQARVILGSAEAAIAGKFVEAALTYADHPMALRLRAMNKNGVDVCSGNLFFFDCPRVSKISLRLSGSLQRVLRDRKSLHGLALGNSAWRSSSERSGLVPIDGTKGCHCGDPRLRYVSDFWAPLDKLLPDMGCRT